MADFPNLHSSPLSQQHTLQPDESISPPQTLDHLEDDDLVNVDDSDVPYTFVIDPFYPIDSSLYVPPSSSEYHHRNHRNQQVNSNSCYRCLSETESESELESDCADSTVYPDCLYGRDDEYDQMDYVTDLFDSRVEIERVSGCLSSNDVGISDVNDHDDEFVNNNIEDLGLGLGLGLEDGDGGLRVTRIESESDTEDLGGDQNNERIETTDLNVDNATVDERDGLSSVIERIEEISVSSDISSEGDSGVGVLEWEILLAVNNLERDLEFATEGGEEGFVYTPEFDTLIGQFVETVRALRGSPPTAKSFIDNLPSVALKKGDLSEDDSVICAVCKDEISMEERVTQLPCKHHYHEECIVPWLSIRNTCPVCRFELPTDDVDYERSKNRVEDDDGELRVGYGF